MRGRGRETHPTRRHLGHKNLITRPSPPWEVVRSYIEEQIAIGAYPVGSWLPSVREFADSLSVNRNTVGKAYQAMSRDGLIQGVNGRGVRVMAANAIGHSSEDRVLEHIEAVVRDARFSGLTRQWVLDRTRDVNAAVYKTAKTAALQIGFVECADLAAISLAKDIGKHLGPWGDAARALRCRAAAEQALRGLDLLTTTFFHLGELSEVRAAKGLEIVGIHHAVSHQSALAIASMKPGSVVAVVVSTGQTLQKLLSTVQPFVQGDIRATLSTDRAQLRRVLDGANVVIDLPNTHAVVKRQRPDLESITVRFHIEPHSLEHLREVVRRSDSALRLNGRV